MRELNLSQEMLEQIFPDINKWQFMAANKLQYISKGHIARMHVLEDRVVFELYFRDQRPQFRWRRNMAWDYEIRPLHNRDFADVLQNIRDAYRRFAELMVAQLNKDSADADETS